MSSRLIENEIGGVIQGSLSAAIARRPLNRDEYLKEKRSNIPLKNDGEKKRQVRTVARLYGLLWLLFPSITGCHIELVSN